MEGLQADQFKARKEFDPMDLKHATGIPEIDFTAEEKPETENGEEG